MSERSTKEQLIEALRQMIEDEVDRKGRINEEPKGASHIVNISLDTADPHVIDSIKTIVVSGALRRGQKKKGMVLVPAEPTHEMCLAGNAHVPCDVNSDAVYRAMIQRWREA